MASFNDRKLRRIPIAAFPDGAPGSIETIYTATGEQIIDVTMGPDGNPYIATTDFSSGRILRLVPN